jgi:hypothetical protein
MITDAATDAIQDRLISVTYDAHLRTMTFCYEAGAAILVNECVAWSENVDEVVLYDGDRMAHRFRQTSPDEWDDELNLDRACTLAPHRAIRGRGWWSHTTPAALSHLERPSEE